MVQQVAAEQSVGHTRTAVGYTHTHTHTHTDCCGLHTQCDGAGDVDQLPPVGPGKVLSDAIQSGVIPGVDLRQIFRQAQQSNIVRTAHAVNRGDYQAVPLSLQLLPATALQVRSYHLSISLDITACDTLEQ